MNTNSLGHREKREIHEKGSNSTTLNLLNSIGLNDMGGMSWAKTR